MAARYGLVAGVDEVGRGALAGPIVVAAVILDLDKVPDGVDDSKRLSPRMRQRLAREIRATAVAWSLAHCTVAEVDGMGIVAATEEAMRRAVAALSPQPAWVVADALAPAGLAMPVLAEFHADARYLCVAAASILAKVARDAMMDELAVSFPGYGWEGNKGYGTPRHLAALRRLGPSVQHRRSFAPVRVLAFEAGR